jgi:hypothetical protein
MRMAATLIMAISWMGACAPVEFAPEKGHFIGPAGPAQPFFAGSVHRRA